MLSGIWGNSTLPIACYAAGTVELKPDSAEVHSNLLLTLQYRFGVTLSELAAVHAEYNRLHAAPLRTAQDTSMRMIAILIVGFAWDSSRPISVGTRWGIF